MKMTEKISKREANGAVKLIALILFVQTLIFLVSSPPPIKSGANEVSTEIDTTIGTYANSVANSVANAVAGTDTDTDTDIKTSLVTAVKNIKPPHPQKIFSFDPNTVTGDQLQLLGLSQAQAASFLKYRERGGKFIKKEDLLKVYVISEEFYKMVCDSVFFSKIDLNSADSSTLVLLPGIGPYYASRIIEYREATGGFAHTSQLMEIRGIDSARFSLLSNRVVADTAKIVKREISSMSEQQLAANPNIGPYLARSISRYLRQKENEHVSLLKLVTDNVISDNLLKKLSYYFY